MDDTKAERSEFKKWFWMGVGLLILAGFIFWVLGALGLIGKTMVEREVFKRSFQYSEARKTEIATFEAQLAEIDRKLASSDLDKNTRDNLEAQAASIRIQLRVAKEKQ